MAHILAPMAHILTPMGTYSRTHGTYPHTHGHISSHPWAHILTPMGTYPHTHGTYPHTRMAPWTHLCLPHLWPIILHPWPSHLARYLKSVANSLAAHRPQVHTAKLKDGRTVAMKVQYPGVARSIESDVDNLMRLITVANILPKGLYVENAVQARGCAAGPSVAHAVPSACSARHGPHSVHNACAWLWRSDQGGCAIPSWVRLRRVYHVVEG